MKFGNAKLLVISTITVCSLVILFAPNLASAAQPILAPTGLTAVLVDQTQIRLGWTAPTGFGDNLIMGYYTYAVSIINEQVDKSTKHGISRDSNLFKSYVKGQELIATQWIKNNCQKCYDASFAEINQIFAYDFPDGERFTPKLKKAIEKETLKASIRFNELYNMTVKR